MSVTSNALEHPGIYQVATNKTATYNVSSSEHGIIFTGHGYQGDILPNLILLRGNDYTFEFYNKDSVFDFYDTRGNLIQQHDIQSWHEPFSVNFNQSVPSELKYISRTTGAFGTAHIRNPNQINGRVSSYGFGSGAIVNRESVQVVTDVNGVFLGYVSSTQTPGILR